MKSIALVAPPPVYAVQVVDVLNQLGMSQPTDVGLQASLAAKIGGQYIPAAQARIESISRRVLITQTWLLRRDSFPGRDFRYEAIGYAHIELPKPPFQSVDFLRYIDVSGALQTLYIDTTFGTDPANPEYGYQLDRGSETQPARLLPPFARPWPPTRMVPANVICQFRCGYGGPLNVTMAANSAVVSGQTFNPDDAPLLPGDTGLCVVIPGALAGGGTLVTNIASVASDGQATLAAPATAAVENAQAWFGPWLANPAATGAAAFVPAPLLQATIFLAAWFYEQGSVAAEIPEFVFDLISEYRWLA